MIKKLLFVASGATLLILVVALGICASENSSYVIWFGLSAAILAPLAFVLFGHALKGNEREILTNLSKVPELKELIRKAHSEEERLRILEDERKKLDETIRIEVRHQILFELRSQLEKEVKEKTKKYKAVLDELQGLDQEVESSPVRQEIEQIQKILSERKRGRIIIIHIGNKEFIFPVRKLGNDPLSIGLLLMLLGIEKWQGRNAQPTLQVDKKTARRLAIHPKKKDEII